MQLVRLAIDGSQSPSTTFAARRVSVSIPRLIAASPFISTNTSYSMTVEEVSKLPSGKCTKALKELPIPELDGGTMEVPCPVELMDLI